MEPDPILVEIVQYSHTKLVPLPVVRLRSIGTSSVGPVNIVVSLLRGPPDVSLVHFSASPEVSLPVLGDKSEKLPLLG